MHRKGHKAPFALLTLVLLFGRKKTVEENETPPYPPKQEAFPIPDSLKKSVTGIHVSKARDRLRIASLEREIIGDALTKIYEAESKGEISDNEKNQLLQRYKSDLKRVDSEIDTHKKTVDLFELESAKEELLKSFNEKMMEIDLKIKQIKPTMSLTEEPRTIETTPVTTKAEPPQASQPANTAPKEKPGREKPKNKAEERLETIREEVLKAMERLEQIETEG